MGYYLDAAPMIRALSENPSAFEVDGNFIRHRPSRHWLSFDWHGNALIADRCNCAELPVRREQSDALRAAVAVWQETYWRPLMVRKAAERRAAAINRAFAGHFRPRSKLRRSFDAILSFFGVKDRVWLNPVHLLPPEDAQLPIRQGSGTCKTRREELVSA